MKILGIILLLLAGAANATGKMPAATSASADANASAESASSASAGNGDQVSMNSSQFYALSLMFPEGGGCFTGVQGGAHDDNTGGFLGVRFLSKSCWLNQLASTERDIELNARLLCGDKKYRNAIAYDAKAHGQSKRERCISLKAESGKQQVAEWRSALDDAIGGNKELIDQQGEILRGEIAEAEERLKERDARIHQAGVEK